MKTILQRFAFVILLAHVEHLALHLLGQLREGKHGQGKHVQGGRVLMPAVNGEREPGVAREISGKPILKVRLDLIARHFHRSQGPGRTFPPIPDAPPAESPSERIQIFSQL